MYPGQDMSAWNIGGDPGGFPSYPNPGPAGYHPAFQDLGTMPQPMGSAYQPPFGMGPGPEQGMGFNQPGFGNTYESFPAYSQGFGQISGPPDVSFSGYPQANNPPGSSDFPPQNSGPTNFGTGGTGYQPGGPANFSVSQPVAGGSAYVPGDPAPNANWKPSYSDSGKPENRPFYGDFSKTDPVFGAEGGYGEPKPHEDIVSMFTVPLLMRYVLIKATC